MTNPLYDALLAPHAGSARVFLQLSDGSQVTYAAFVRLAARYANAFVEFGLVPGDRVAAQVRKSHHALALYAACVQSGTVFLPLNTAYTASEVSYFIEDSEAALFVCDGAAKDAPAAVAGTRPVTLNADGTGSLAETARTVSDKFATVARTVHDLAAILYTSGTTGRSKGAMLTQNNLLSNCKTLKDCWRFTDTDVLLHALPIFHTHGLFVATNITLLAGGTMSFLPAFDVDDVLDRMGHATVMMGVPTFYTRLLNDPRFTREKALHMRLFVSGSAPLPADIHRRFESRTGHRILERYGMTETNMNTSNPYDGDRRPGTVGFPLPGVELKITDPATGRELPHGEIGQIEVRGENVFKGYWRMSEKTREELREDGFFITGDLGLIDNRCYVQIVGRSKDLIISGGYNIYPKEIELILDAQPGVLESAVIGVPHADFGESVLAVLVPRPGTLPDIDRIDEALRNTLARFKRPRRYEIVPRLPRNAMGKVQKNVLRAQFA
ncbi:MAG: malonyl-CoA synthase [Pseudomonadota bacterium]